MARLVPTLALCAVVTFSAMTAGCTSTVEGAAVKSQGSVPADDVPPLDESDLDGLLLSNNELNSIAGAEWESFYATDELNENADLVSNPDCLAAVYPGESEAYAQSDWTAARDELLIDAAGEDDSHIIEQTLVVFDTAEEAVEFFEQSRDVWRDCAGSTDTLVEDTPWDADDVQEAGDRMITQSAEVGGTLEGICQHALGVVANLIVEGYSCDDVANDDAEKLVTRIMEAAAEN
jgi:PknH-like extracellular domain